MFDMFKDKVSEETKAVSSPTNIFVISVGGSVFFEEKPLTSAIVKFGETINSLSAEGYKFVLVVGGGKICRRYVASAKALGASNFVQDGIGIAVTRLNARIFIEAISNTYPVVLKDINKVKEVIDSGKIAVFGGLMPGITTDAVAAIIAESLNATFINLTNVRGIYSQDPKKYRGAKLFPELTYDKLISLMKLAESKPAQNIVLDLPCCLILKRSKIKGIVLKGSDLANFEAAIRGGEFKGTIIQEPEPEEKKPETEIEEEPEEEEEDFSEENVEEMDL